MGDEIRRFSNYRQILNKAILCLIILLCCVPAYAENTAQFPGKGDYAAWKNAVNSYNKALDLAKEKKIADSAELLEKAISIYPSDYRFHYVLANKYAALGDLAKARFSYETALKLEPSFAQAWYGLGNILDKQKNMSGAERAYYQATSIAPSYKEAWFNLGANLYDQKKYKESKSALQSFLKVTKTPNDIADANYYLKRIESTSKLEKSKISKVGG